jgi:hypothetical protein
MQREALVRALGRQGIVDRDRDQGQSQRTNSFLLDSVTRPD